MTEVNPRRRASRWFGFVAIAASTSGCDAQPQRGAEPQPTGGAPASGAPTFAVPTAASAQASAPAATSIPSPTPYTGPTGNVRGRVRIKGDPAPATPHVYPPGCEGEAAAMYGKLFRTGTDGALADAIVSVTKYEGFVPPRKESIPVSVKHCAYSTRSIAMTDGQHLEVRNFDEDTTSYLPWLDGAKLPAGIVAVPQGEPVKLYSRGYGRYWLRDQMARTFMVAHVFHFRYGTTAVTGLDGAYRIEGIPVGKVEVSAMLPQANLLSVTKPFEVKEGVDNVIDLELVFDAKRDVPEKPEDALSESGNKPRH
jgi:hypothetical protein